MNLPFRGLTTDVIDRDTIILGVDSGKFTEEKNKTYYVDLIKDLFRDIRIDILVTVKNTTNVVFDE